MLGKIGGLLGGGSKGGSSSQSMTVQVPEWLDTQNKALVDRAATLSNRPFQAYTGRRVFDFSPDTLAAFDRTRQTQGEFRPLLNQSTNLLNTLASRAQGPTSAQIQERMNPFTENVLNTARRRTIENFRTQNDEFARNRALAGAFGGSRFAVQESQNQRNLLDGLQDLDYRGMFDAFNNAQNQFGRENETLMNAAGQFANVAQQGQQLNAADIAALRDIGATQQLRDQAQLDINFEDFDREQAFPYEQLNFLSNIVTPQTNLYRGQTTTTTQQGSRGSGLGNILGTALQVAGTFAKTPSDKRLKEDIKKVGELDNGLPVYSYKYKEGGPKQIGVMAQDVEKVKPEAVTEDPDSGFKMVDYGQATQKFAQGGDVRTPTREQLAKQLIATGITPLPSMSGGGGGSSASEAAGAGAGSMSGLGDMLFGGKSGTTNLFGSKVQDFFDEGTGSWGTFTGSGPGLDFADFGNIGSSIGSFFGFNEGGDVRVPMLADPLRLPKQENIRERLLPDISPTRIIPNALANNLFVDNLRGGKDVQYAPSPEDSRLSRLGQRVGVGAANLVGNTVDLPFKAGTLAARGLEWLNSPPEETVEKKAAQQVDKTVPGGLDAVSAEIQQALGTTPPSQAVSAPAGQVRPLPVGSNNTATYNDLGASEAGLVNSREALVAGPSMQQPMPSFFEMLNQPQATQPPVSLQPEDQQQGSWLDRNGDLLAAIGRGMVASDGDFFEQLSYGLEQGRVFKEAQRQAQKEEEKAKLEAAQQAFENQLNQLKTMAYVAQVNAAVRKTNSSGSAKVSPADALREEKLRLEIQKQQLENGKLAKEIMGATTPSAPSENDALAEAAANQLLN